MDRYDAWKSREPDPRDYEPGSQWRQRLLWHDGPEPTSRKLLRQIQHAAGLDPDGPRLVPMQPPLSREQAVQAAHRAAKAVTRDRMLCRAIGLLW